MKLEIITITTIDVDDDNTTTEVVEKVWEAIHTDSWAKLDGHHTVLDNETISVKVSS